MSEPYEHAELVRRIVDGCPPLSPEQRARIRQLIHAPGGVTEICGHIYVIELSNGTIKVGQTEYPHQRLSTHRRGALRFGLTVVREWCSSRHLAFLANEKRLISFCKESGGEYATGRRSEYFTGLDFTIIQAFAEQLAESLVDAPR
ncbi:hypothetical protein ABZV14_01135 [Streptosporangium canum]|uniref:hypothetical protein n=1 Tax=Streptosporangium canum TaxID=324952 RepID=UPI00339DD571